MRGCATALGISARLQPRRSWKNTAAEQQKAATRAALQVLKYCGVKEQLEYACYLTWRYDSVVTAGEISVSEHQHPAPDQVHTCDQKHPERDLAKGLLIELVLQPEPQTDAEERRRYQPERERKGFGAQHAGAQMRHKKQHRAEPVDHSLHAHLFALFRAARHQHRHRGRPPDARQPAKWPRQRAHPRLAAPAVLGRETQAPAQQRGERIG